MQNRIGRIGLFLFKSNNIHEKRIAIGSFYVFLGGTETKTEQQVSKYSDFFSVVTKAEGGVM